VAQPSIGYHGRLPSIEKSSSTTMTVPYYMSETKSDMRGIKHGWYAIEDDGTLYSGPFPSFEECAERITSLPTSDVEGGVGRFNQNRPVKD
jgi:hypothetical protein